MTELEAKEKWCPFAHVLWAKYNDCGKFMTKGDGSFNRARIEFTTQEIPIGLCMGKQCMAWRIESEASPEFERDGQTVPATIESGYCGLAGKV